MNKRPLGKTGIELSELGFGCSGLWGKNVLGKPAITEERAFDVVKAAVDSDITFFDTGINYGFAEERLGRCLSKLIKNSYDRSEFVIETKFGEVVGNNGELTGESSFQPDWIKRSLEISLKRLQTDYIDLFAAHGGRPEQFSDETFKCLENLKNQGLIRAFGINTFDTDVIKWVSKEKRFDYVMLDYNIMRQDRESLIKKLYDSEIGVIGGAALAEGLYSKRKMKNLNDIWYLLRAKLRFKEQSRNGRNYRFINEVHGMTGNQIALRYVLDNPYVSASVFNTTSPEHLRENTKSVYMEIPKDIRERIKTVGKR